MDYPEHERTYAPFVTFTKWGRSWSSSSSIGMAIFLL